MICEEKLCTGCHACYSICPTHAISMQPDKEGFLHPVVDEQKCVHCGLCEQVCPILHEKPSGDNSVAYACINKSEEQRCMSSSGGIFSLIARKIIQKGGIVYGAAFGEKLQVRHEGVSLAQNIYKLMGSKYVQSTIGDSYKSAKEELEKGRWVLFSGTPCQIGGLRSFLGKEYETLITQDIICHGVPSSKVWRKYIEYQERKNKSQISEQVLPSFRDKKRGWRRFSMRFQFENGKKYTRTLDTDPYIKLFLQDITLRNSCYNCQHKSLNRESDITLADFWGIETICPDLFDDKGTSLVFINSDKGKKLFAEIESDIIYKMVDLNAATKQNTAAFQSVAMPTEREVFFADLEDMEISELVKKYVTISYRKVVISTIRWYIKRIIELLICTKKERTPVKKNDKKTL